MMTLASLEAISIRTVYDNHMVSVALSDIVMDTTTVEYNIHDNAKDVEECRWDPIDWLQPRLRFELDVVYRSIESRALKSDFNRDNKEEECLEPFSAYNCRYMVNKLA